MILCVKMNYLWKIVSDPIRVGKIFPPIQHIEN